MTGYTRGSWFVVRSGNGDQKVVCGDGVGNWRLAFMTTFSGSREELAEIDANARLISAAPDMAEVLLRLLKWVEPIAGNNRDAAAKQEELASVEAARAALKKAGIE